MVAFSCAAAAALLSGLRFPLLVIGMVDRNPYAVVRADGEDEYLAAAHWILSGSLRSHVVVTSLTGDSPGESRQLPSP